jgi:Xaa-Pro aminopeptidase
MQERGIDQLVVADPANINYLTGYNAWSFYTPQVLVVPAQGELLFLTREVDAPGAILTTHLTDDQVLGFPEGFVQQMDRHPMDWIAEQIRDRGLGEGVVAVELEASHHTVRAHHALVAGLPGASIVDAAYLVNWVRAVKTDAEMEKMRIAGRIAGRVMRTALERIDVGVRQCDLVADIYAAQIRGLEDAGGDYTAIVPMLPSGPGTGVPHLTWSDVPFQGGEATTLALAGCHQRYHSPLARTVFLGTPPKRLTDIAKVVTEGLRVALDAVRPGTCCEDVAAAWTAVIGRHGLTKAGRIGYSVGVNYPPDWGEHTMSLRAGDATVLAPNMTFHMILGMWMDGWGYSASETFAVTEEGAECLASCDRDLVVKP